MASQKKQLSFVIQRFKGFWNQYRQSKRGMLGIIIITFFGVVAVAAPLLSPLDPMNPKWPGYFPGGEQPKLADRLCVPIWYKSLLGMQSLAENTEVVEDPEFHRQELFGSWVWRTSNASYNVDVQYSLTGGSHDDDGCVKISYTREAGQQPPPDGQITVTLEKEFSFPYDGSPASFYWHSSIRVENTTELVQFPIRASVFLRRIDGASAEGTMVSTQPLTSSSVSYKWYSKAGATPGDTSTIEEEIFTQAGTYVYSLAITIVDSGSENKVTVSVDNVQMLLYGRAFGLLGTTSIPMGSPRDLFTMLIYGTRISFMIGTLTAVFSVLIGLSVGLVAGYLRGVADEVLMRFADFLLVIPGLPLLIILVTVLGKSIWNIIGVLIFMGWMGFSRSVRSMVLSLRERPFIESAKAAGAGTFYIIYRHILPNVFALVYISLATAVPGAIISEASLAWLGLGDINIPSWGIMLYDFSEAGIAGTAAIGSYWFWVIPPGIAIALMAMSFILMGFAMDEILNPRLRRRK